MTYDHIILHCMTNKIKWLFLLIMSFYELMFRFFFFFNYNEKNSSRIGSQMLAYSSAILV